MPKEKPSYEQLSDELNHVLDQLQSENCSIEDALSLFEKGNQIVKELQSYLENAENRLKQVSEKSE